MKKFSIVIICRNIVNWYGLSLFYLFRVGCCYSIVLKNSHACVEGAMHHDCPICFEVGVLLLFIVQDI
jgi:hypothetical protein